MKTLANSLIAVFLLTSLNSIAQKVTEHKIEVEDCTLFGTLSESEDHMDSTLVIIVAGSGATDRNLGEGMAYAMLSDSLVKNGISVFRYDKRTAGESVKTLSRTDLIFDDFVNDVIAIVTYFKDQSQYNKTVLLGHSQGSLVSILASQKSDVDGFISMAGGGQPIDSILRYQLYDNFLNKMMLEPIVEPLFDSIRQGIVVDSVHPLIASLFNPKNQPFLRNWMQYDPAEEIKKLDIPVMIVNGSTDFQVTVDQAKRLYEAYPESEYLIVENMTHVMKYCEEKSKLKNMEVYGKPEIPLIEDLVPRLVTFIKSIN